MKTKIIKQTIIFNAAPSKVYAALMSSKKHAEFTGAAAKISCVVGGKFTAWDGYIEGRNKKLVKNKKIVQEWRAQEDAWPAGHYSIATFEFKKDGKGCKLSFTQTGVPLECASSIASGWKEYYWEPMKNMLE